MIRVMDNSCGKENTVCAVVECCPGFVCQPFEGDCQINVAADYDPDMAQYVPFEGDLCWYYDCLDDDVCQPYEGILLNLKVDDDD